ncbi:alpha/beta hydrolase [Herbiconiux sp. KACC 21604]|uniref:alpha/beta fold hydrolase n=1 Tax=unclassified Herbiconiux TaxID=2618217 RepID=UPI0014927FAE|nr:alpha/beta hydrolase [Herbiconiux sp. SALV-R1]QJU55236.1 alpha/beta fold hydrolase [Herbiconiux sp. SALV-R1]WPO86402.1 alpha/beta hydrolase [Herbiconiux sp. KACC 21604]
MSVALDHSEQGPVDAPPLVLLMGLGAPAAAWQPHVDAWSQSHRCILVENRGSAGSPEVAGPATTAELAKDVATLLERVGAGPAAVAGISMGACIAQELAIARPELVSRLVLVAPWARVDPFTASILSLLGRLRATGDHRLLNEALRDLVWTPDHINRHATEQSLGLDAAPALSAEAFASQVAACRSHFTLDRLAGIRCPTLVTLGEQDAFIRSHLSAEVAAGIPSAELRRFATGHVHHWEELDSFNDTVREWLR